MASVPALSALNGPTYVTAQTLIQQVAYLLSDKIFSYSPESFDLDAALKEWTSKNETNSNGESPAVKTLETRQGAGNMALGYLFSQDFDLKKRHIPQGIVASSATLPYMRAALEQLSLLYSVASPVAAHVAAVDYAGEGLVSDYASALALAEELGLGLVSSGSAHESQHMALFTTLLSSILPSVHIYDGVRVGRETTRVIDVLDKDGLTRTYESVRKTLDESRTRHLDSQGKVLDLLKTLNGELGTDYGAFEYHGHAEPVSVLVAFGTVEAALTAQIARSLAKDGVRVGVVNVRVYRPFIEEEFLRVLPQSTKTVGILGQVASEQAVQEEGIHSALYEDVLAALTFATGREQAPTCVEIKYPRSQRWDLVSTAAAFQRVFDKPILPINSETNQTAPLQLLDPSSVHEYTFWDVDSSVTSEAAHTLGQALGADSASNVTTSKVHDNLVQGGAVRIDIRKSAKIVDAPYAVTAADVSYVGSIALLKEVDVLASVKDNGKVIVNAPGIKDEDLEKKLPAAFKQGVAQRAISVFIVDPSIVDDSSLDSLVLQASFVRVALPSQEGVATKKLSAITGNAEALDNVTKDLEKVLRQIEVPETWKEPEGITEAVQLPKDIVANSFVSFDKTEAEPPTLLKDWETAARGLAFKEAYGTRDALRPDLATKTFTVHVKENRRLTPTTYDRNIFHIEFDLGNTGLKYDIGEALGVHAENDPADINKFIEFYGLNPDAIVEVPSREDPAVLENRTVYQALIQNVDIYGRPPKRFYEALAEFATDEKEKKDLQTLGGPDGATEFKRRAEVDTITFADVLLEYPSAHPDFHEIVRIVGPLKRREYSIASCQKVTPTTVALMIVAVNWTDPSGRDRFGLATRYLSRLRAGSPITVSVKSSVMKLPPKSTQPIIMAGLGTGLAPFRAFVQHRAL